ncbi:MAG: hypothetical protein KC777_18610 [Cyanobacteria bacterium HKST-UBA02]|nr:hypothetical protein [Cyanobacteria bacterium HKST-UBA02]
MKQILVIAFGLTYAIFATMAIGKVFGAGGALVSIIAGAIAIAIVQDCVKERPW